MADQPDKSTSPKMFNAIAKRYDILNYVLSFGMDRGWRRQLARYLPSGEDLRVLDLATGTADVAIALVKSGRDIQDVVGIDLADEMLAVGRAKVERAGLSNKICLQKADALSLPFPSESFDVVTVSFGLRNMPDLVKALLDARRVLNLGGRIMILEFSKPDNKFVKLFYLFYLLAFLPVLGFLLTGNYQAYRYLSRTVYDFPCGERFQQILQQVGFTLVGRFALACGAATIYIAEKRT